MTRTLAMKKKTTPRKTILETPNGPAERWTFICDFCEFAYNINSLNTCCNLSLCPYCIQTHKEMDHAMLEEEIA